jgi:hypothetical protein
MNNMENEAKVYGDGDVTIVCNVTTNSARVFVGTQPIGFIQKLRLNLDHKEPQVDLEFTFPQSYDQATALKIEEQVRSVKQQLPWAKVIR